MVLLERESQCGYHSTGRSAASFTENYGTPIVRRLAMASRTFLQDPPTGFCDHPLLSPRGMITIARADQLGLLEQQLRLARALVSSIVELDVAATLDRLPILRQDYLAGAFIEPHSMELDVNGLHQGYLRAAKAKGARIVVNAGVDAIGRTGERWRIATRAGTFCAPMIVNAAGAWADELAQLAGIRPLGLTPKRRTAFNIPVPSGIDIRGWPMVNDVAEEFYFKPDAGQLFVSPADATPTRPMDALPRGYRRGDRRRAAGARNHVAGPARHAIMGGAANLRAGRIPGCRARCRREWIFLAGRPGRLWDQNLTVAVARLRLVDP